MAPPRDLTRRLPLPWRSQQKVGLSFQMAGRNGVLSLAGDDPTLGSLPKDLGQPNDGHGARGDDIRQDLTRTN